MNETDECIRALKGLWVLHLEVQARVCAAERVQAGEMSLEAMIETLTKEPTFYEPTCDTPRSIRPGHELDQ